MSIRSILHLLRRERKGAVAVEFGLLGGIMVTLLLGVLQIGIAMQSYNALRGIAADVARHAVVEYQSGAEMTNDELMDYGRSVATRSPYDLKAQDVVVSVTTATTQRVTGATELSVTVQTGVASILALIGVESFTISHTRPIFVIDE